MIYAVTAAALMFAVAPAHADAKASDGRVGCVLGGKGLRVTGVGAHMDGHGTGVRARLITYRPKGYQSELTGWKDATPVSVALTKMSMVSWKWGGKGRAFEHGTKLCVEFHVVQGEGDPPLDRGSGCRAPPLKVATCSSYGMGQRSANCGRRWIGGSGSSLPTRWSKKVRGGREVTKFTNVITGIPRP
ncbi:hypothetical protein ACWGIU_33120 [Streptomyces sp. NPDC054840]